MGSIRQTIATVLGLASVALAATVCNGEEAYCSRSYSNITQIGAHDSAFVGILPSQNQYISAKSQLNMGVRFLQTQSRDKDGTVEMCHTDCDLLDQGTFETYLKPIKTWLDANKNDVVTLLVVNPDGMPISKFGDVFQAVGLDKYAFAPEGTVKMEEWPTLQSMINAGTRFVVFIDEGADTSVVPYILPEWTYYFETPFGVTDKNFPDCSLDRPANSSPDGKMYIINHFLNVEILGIKIPAAFEAMKTNSVSSIVAQADLCTAKYAREPQVILLDFTNIGDAMGAQTALNNV